MKTNPLQALLVSALIVVVLFISCKHEIPFNAQDPPVIGGMQTCSADTVYFQNKVLPLLNSSCAMSCLLYTSDAADE